MPTAVADVAYPAVWTGGQYQTLRLVVTQSPYRVKPSALKHLQKTVAEQAGLQVDIIEGEDTGLPTSGGLSKNDIWAAALSQAPEGDNPAAVLVVVNDAAIDNLGYVFYDRKSLVRLAQKRNIALSSPAKQIDRFLAVIVLNRAHWQERLFEDIVLLHEVGHWLGVPARNAHTAEDHLHCTNGRCVMFSGKWSFETTLCLIGANLLTGPPKTFCPNCAEELAYMRRLREEQGSSFWQDK